MFKLFNIGKPKRASLNLSINAIVIVVLAMTLLGLGLGFIRGMFKEISGMTTEVQEQVKEQITAQLRTTGEKISFPRAVVMGRGDRKVLTLGVQNTGSSTIFFGFNLSLDPENSDHIKSKEFKDIIEAYDPRYLSHPCAFFLGPAEADAYGINLKAPKTAGTDMLIVNVLLAKKDAQGDCIPEFSGETFATKTAFITVG